MSLPGRAGVPSRLFIRNNENETEELWELMNADINAEEDEMTLKLELRETRPLETETSRRIFPFIDQHSC